MTAVEQQLKQTARSIVGLTRRWHDFLEELPAEERPKWTAYLGSVFTEKGVSPDELIHPEDVEAGSM